LNRIAGPRPVATTKKNQSSLPLPLPTWSSRYSALRVHSEGALVYVAAEPNKPPNPSDFIENENQWLRDEPFLVTNNNKHFVVVESANSEDVGKAAMQVLKSKHPQYDFVLYAPYDGNPNYGIMMASWASYDIAKKALAVAKKINPSAFIWSCRYTGESCWH
jgi:hypothetical protein